jgi:hypothetical protein
MPGIGAIEDDTFEDQDIQEEEENADPTMAQKLVEKLHDAAAWYNETIHPHVLKVKEPIGYLLWCAVTIGVIAGLPTAKAVFSDPYTELSVEIQEREMERASTPGRPRNQ